MRTCIHLQEVNGSSAEQRTHANGTSLPGRSVVSVGRSAGRVSSIGSVLADAGGRSGLATGVWDIRNRRCALECWLSLFRGRVGNGRVRGVEDLVDDVDNTVGNENVGSDDTSVVHEDTALTDSNGKLLSVGSRESSTVLEGRRVANTALSDDVVGKDAASVLSAEVAESRADVLESLVVGCEDGDVRCVVNGVEQLGRVDGSTEGNKVCSRKGIGSVLREGQNTVDDVDHTTSEVHVLRLLAERKAQLKKSTYSCCNS